MDILCHKCILEVLVVKNIECVVEILLSSLVEVLSLSVVKGKEVSVRGADIMEIKGLCRQISCCSLVVMSLTVDACYMG